MKEVLENPPLVEKRNDPKDGRSYTKQEFFKYYGVHEGFVLIHAPARSLPSASRGAFGPYGEFKESEKACILNPEHYTLYPKP